MNGTETSGGLPAGAGGREGGTGGASGDTFQPPLMPTKGMSLRELAALAEENARRVERARLALLRVGRKEARFDVYAHLLHAATEETGNYRHLWEAVRDARELHPDGDPRRDAPLPGPYPTDALDERNASARYVAYRVLEGAELVPAPGELLGRLAVPQVDGPPPSDGLPPLMGRALAEAAMRPLDPQTERIVAGWPAYVIPWQHAAREVAAVSLVSKARKALRDGGDPTPILASLAALAVLERDSREEGWRPATWATLREFAGGADLPTLAASVLRAALDTERPPISLADLVLAASRGDVPTTPEAVADLVDRAARAAGCLSAKTIDPDPIRRTARRVLTLTLADPIDGRLMAAVLVGLHTVAAWPEPGRTPRFMLADCSLRSIVAGSPSRDRRDRAALGIALLALIEARERGTDEREVKHGSHLSDHDVTCSSVLAEVLREGDLSEAARSLLRDVMEGRGGEGAALSERIIRVADGSHSESANTGRVPVTTEEKPTAPVDPLLLDLTDDGKALRLGRHELLYVKSDGKRRVTPTNAEGRLLLSLAKPGGVPAAVRPDAVPHLRVALEEVAGAPVRLEGIGGELRLSRAVRLSDRLRDDSKRRR